MNELSKERLFSLLSENSQVVNEKMQSAYESFMEQLRTASQSDRNYSGVFRMLNVTRIELESLQSLYRYEHGEKCPKINLSTKGVGTYQC